MKKLNTIIVVLIAALAFMACEKADSNKNRSASNDIKQKEINDRNNSRYEIQYYIDTSLDTINSLSANFIDGLIVMSKECVPILASVGLDVLVLIALWRGVTDNVFFKSVSKSNFWLTHS